MQSSLIRTLSNGSEASGSDARTLSPPGQRDMSYKSFVPQRDDGIDFHGAARGDVAGGDGDEHQDDGDACEGEWVVGCDAEKLRGHEAREAKRGGDADGYADEGHARALSKNQAQNVGALRAECDAHAEFVSALRDGIGDNGVESKHREQNSAQREESDE